MLKKKEAKIGGTKINNVVAVCLLMVVVAGVTQATPPTTPLAGYVEEKVEIVGDYPKVGEIFEVVYQIRLKKLDAHSRGYLHTDFYAVIRGGPSEPIEIIGKDRILFTGLPPVGEWKEFRFRCKIVKPFNHIVIYGTIHPVYKGEMYGTIARMGYLSLYLINPQTGQYGTKEEYEKQLRKQAEWWYDYVAGEFTSEPLAPASAAVNREIIAQIRQIEPNLTDWEALYLHSDGIQALMGGMGTQKTTWEDRWRFLLEQGWLEKQRAGKEVKEKWLKELIEKYKGKPLIKEQGLNPNFFRGDSHDNIGNNFDFPDSTSALKGVKNA